MAGQLIVLGIGRDLVELGDVSPIVDFLRSADADRRSLREHSESLDMVFEGYDDDPREVYEIPEVRAYVAALDAQFSGWLFHFTKMGLGLQTAIFALTNARYDNGQVLMDPTLLAGLLDRWVRGMNARCAAAGFGTLRNRRLTTRVRKYLKDGPPWLSDALAEQ